VSPSPTSRICTGSAGIPAGEPQFWPNTAENCNTPAGMPALPVGGVANPRTPTRTVATNFRYRSVAGTPSPPLEERAGERRPFSALSSDLDVFSTRSGTMNSRRKQGPPLPFPLSPKGGEGNQTGGRGSLSFSGGE